MSFQSYMTLALEEARLAADRGEVPVGAVVVDAAGRVLSSAGNETRGRLDPTAHAEILAIRKACDVLGQDRLEQCDLWVTLEPCAMCAMALSHARIRRLYYGASDQKSGGVSCGARVYGHAQTHHKPDVFDGVDEAACAELLKTFFQEKRR